MADYKLPPLNALRAFDVASRLLNVTQAAAALFVTQPAISQQLKILEDYLQVKLFEREGIRLRLTTQGIEYATRIQIAFDQIRTATKWLNQEQTRHRIITVNMLTTFAMRWFIPRLENFQTAHPDFELRTSTPIKKVDFSQDEIDAAIYCGDGNWPELEKSFLFRDELFPVCSQNYFKQKAKNGELIIENCKLLTVAAPEREKDWPAWLHAAKYPPLSKLKVMKFPTLEQSVQAAMNGLGIAMGHSILFAEDLRTKRLMAPWKLRIPAPFGYYLVYPQFAKDDIKIKLLRKWLLSFFEE